MLHHFISLRYLILHTVTISYLELYKAVIVPYKNNKQKKKKKKRNSHVSGIKPSVKTRPGENKVQEG